MTENRVIAFDVNAGQVAAGAAPRPAAPALPASQRFTNRAKNRATLASAYAGLIGSELSTPDLLERIQTAADASGNAPGLDEMAQALTQSGLSTRILRSVMLPTDGYPALAETTNGQVVLVLGVDGDGVTIYDKTAHDNRAELLLSDLNSLYAGRILQARAPLAELEARHIEQKAKPHWFWGEFRHFRRPFGEVSVASLVANILAVAISLFSMQIYDRVIPYQSQPTLWVLGIGVLLAVCLEATLKIARALLMDNTGRKVEIAVQKRLMKKLLGMKMGPGERKPSEVFASMREFGSVREFFTSATVGTLADLPFLLLFLALVASIAGNMVWLLVAGGIIMVLPGFLMQKKMVRMAAQTQGASVKQARLLYEAVFEHETLTTQRGEDRFNRLWSELVAVNAVQGSEQRRLTTFLSTWSQAVQQVTYISTIIMGTYLVFAGQFTVGTIIAVGILTGRTLGPLAQVSTMMARWSQVKMSLKALEQVAESRQSEDEDRRYLRRDRMAGNFELRNLEFRYDEKSAPVVEINGVAIPQGQHVAVLGSNGSGKSTLLRLLAGLYEPGQGRVLIDGVDLNQVHPRDLRRGIGYLGQEVRLIQGTIRDNLNMNQLERDDDRLLQALDFAGLGPFVRNHPRGLDLEVRELGEGLSVGQRQSVGWARLWLQDPQIVLLDEPTAALDQTLETTLVSRLGTWLKGRTAVIATHRVPILQLTDRTLILQNGKLAVDGPQEAVLAHLAKAQGAKAGAGA
ncbi:ATP-binding cassette domain-containing protein [Xinfangfangia sp. D13-10-4-6]|uniref:ATP-binding cassette domain-containing protein n=1 Tax=Pseudogemmobacter hezensis TaxID=2737662 RepID=UPI0015521801|nr:ATP-binding cassette domain-containing protein [Pseudogemmobacter hezensis]